MAFFEEKYLKKKNLNLGLCSITIAVYFVLAQLIWLSDASATLEKKDMVENDSKKAMQIHIQSVISIFVHGSKTSPFVGFLILYIILLIWRRIQGLTKAETGSIISSPALRKLLVLSTLLSCIDLLSPYFPIPEGTEPSCHKDTVMTPCCE